ncbi:MAG: hypothetical protein AAFY52_00740 [Pseudomonadota bacterium]
MAQLSKNTFAVGGSRWRVVMRLLIIGALVGAANVMLVTGAPPAAGLADLTCGTAWHLVLILALYVLLLSVPFVPGAEVGLALLIGFGAVMAWPVYVATVLGLSVAFAVGRFASRSAHPQPVPGGDPTGDGLAGFGNRLAGRPWLGRLLRFRWIAMAVLINMPGNSAIGGGGGIAMAAGYSRAFPYPAFVVCSAIAVAPVPAMVLIAEHFGFWVAFEQWIRGLVHVPNGFAECA